MPFFNDTLDLKLNMGSDTGTQLVIDELMTPVLNFRVLKLLGCSITNPQLPVDTCAQSPECVNLTWYWADGSLPQAGGFPVHPTRLPGKTQLPQLDFMRNPRLLKLEITPAELVDTRLSPTWLSGTLKRDQSWSFSSLVHCSRFTLRTRTKCVGGIRSIMRWIFSVCEKM